jgi:predicted transcriptional regulator
MDHSFWRHTMTDMNTPKIAESSEAVALVAQPSMDQRICELVAAKSDIAEMTPYQIAALTLQLRQTLNSIGDASVFALDAPKGAQDLQMLNGQSLEQRIRDSVTDEKVTCLCCGESMKMLKRHLGAAHGLTEHEYRQRYGLSEDHPITAPAYTRRKSSYAHKVGFGKYQRAATE